MTELKRRPEPELMDSLGQVNAYADEDFSEAHNQLIDGFVQRFPNFSPSAILDLGCGAADVTLRFAKRFPKAVILGLDAGTNMLARAHKDILTAGLENQITLLQAHLPQHGLTPDRFDAVVSNSLLHHLDKPTALWSSIQESGQKGAAVAVMDLLRPESQAQLTHLVERYASQAPPLLKQDFTHSLTAAYTLKEVEAQLAVAGLHLSVEAISDRHFLAWGHL